ncbi:restriction endonuclease subunit S [Streptomyces sp. NPDC048504]|uniref:restriction endonuclease subunit S n=1 Tax=Streptomyces sp. NPDC048504 TaxID=3365559 RepID=UPI003713F6D7
MREQTMDDLRQVTLGQVLKLRSSRAAGDAPLLSVTASRGVILQEESGRRDSSNVDKSLYLQVHAGDIVYNTMRMWQGVSGLASRDGIVSPAYTVCTPTPDVHPEYLARVLKHPEMVARFYRASQGLVSDTWNVRYSEFAKISTLLPSLREQHRIVEIFDAIDTQIVANRRIVGKLQKTRSGVMDRLFAEGVVAGRQKSLTSVGEIPTSWNVVSIEDICTVESGGTPSRAEEDVFFSTSGTPWVKTLDLNEASISATAECVTDLAIEHTRLRVFPPRTVLVAMYGGWAQIGRTACLAVPAAVNQAVCALRPRAAGEILPEFLMLALQQGRSRWRGFAASTRKDPNITKSDVHDFLVPVPSLSEQERILKVASSYSDRLLWELEAGNRLESLKEALADDLITGRVRVPVSDGL